MNRLSYELRKHPAIRLLALALVVAAGIFLLLLLTRTVVRKPVITSISPGIGTPGDILVIKGDFFGPTRISSYVELCGNRITESSYISWSNKEIKVIIPGNTDDGLVYVVNRGGKSNPEFFANELAIPVFMPADSMMNTPAVTEISPSTVKPGQILVISGRNFGTSRENSAVYFSSRREAAATENIPDMGSLEKNENLTLGSKYPGFIIPSEEDFDYEYWSETEIRVRVPDGAETGSVFVATENECSLYQPLVVMRPAGEKTFPSRHTYLIQVEAAISNISCRQDAVLTLHSPHPAVCSRQAEIFITESVPQPALLNYRNTSIFQFDVTPETRNLSTKQNFAVQCSSIETNINKDLVHPFNDRDRMLYRTYTRADEIIPADTEELVELLPNIIFKVTNSYRRAELIFDYMVQNYKISENIRAPASDPLDLVKSKRGDAYDFAVICTALLRTAGIPARLLSGILVNADKKTRNHWWTEFYLEDFGWVPVDVALGAGLPFEAFQSDRQSGKYYFGNIDAQHLAFTMDHNIVKQSVLNDKVVYLPRSFASQSVWEESSADIEKYNSYWPTPVVLGIY